MTHHLSEKDTELRTARCSECGEVGISRSGTGWVCGNKARANARKWDREHPNRERQGKNTHRLTWKDAETRTGLCVVDGAVEVVPWGRGWICSHRATELGRVSQQAKPLGYCRDCWAEQEGDPGRKRIWLQADGACPRCSEPMDLNIEFAKQAADRRLMDDWEDVEGMHIVSTHADPSWMPDWESAVPGWKTIGARA